MSNVNDDLNERLADFEMALLGMQRVVANLPDTGQAERAIQTDKKLARINTLVAVGLVAILAGLVFDGWTSYRNRGAMECLIEQFTEHRHAQREAHQAFSQKIDAPYTVAAEDQPPPIPHALEAACRPFLENTR